MKRILFLLGFFLAAIALQAQVPRFTSGTSDTFYMPTDHILLAIENSSGSTFIRSSRPLYDKKINESIESVVNGSGGRLIQFTDANTGREVAVHVDNIEKVLEQSDGDILVQVKEPRHRTYISSDSLAYFTTKFDRLEPFTPVDITSDASYAGYKYRGDSVWTLSIIIDSISTRSGVSTDTTLLSTDSSAYCRIVDREINIVEVQDTAATDFTSPIRTISYEDYVRQITFSTEPLLKVIGGAGAAPLNLVFEAGVDNDGANVYFLKGVSIRVDFIIDDDIDGI